MWGFQADRTQRAVDRDIRSTQVRCHTSIGKAGHVMFLVFWQTNAGTSIPCAQHRYGNVPVLRYHTCGLFPLPFT